MRHGVGFEVFGDRVQMLDIAPSALYALFRPVRWLTFRIGTNLPGVFDGFRQWLLRPVVTGPNPDDVRRGAIPAASGAGRRMLERRIIEEDCQRRPFPARVAPDVLERCLKRP